MGVWFTLFKRDLKAATAFPRFEILLLLHSVIFVIVSSTFVIDLRRETFLWEGAFSQQVQSHLSWYLAFYLYLIPPLLMTELVTGEVERGTMLTLISYPVKRWQIFTSKYLASLIISVVTIALTFTFSIFFGASFNNVALDLRLVYSYFAALLLLAFFLSSLVSLLSNVSNRLLVSVVSFIGVCLFWNIIVTALAGSMSIPYLQIYVFTETVKQFAYLLSSPEGPFGLYSAGEIVSAVVGLFVFCLVCLGLSFLVFNGKEFK